jgi:hypothetical protein
LQHEKLHIYLTSALAGVTATVLGDAKAVNSNVV